MWFAEAYTVLHACSWSDFHYLMKSPHSLMMWGLSSPSYQWYPARFSCSCWRSDVGLKPDSLTPLPSLHQSLWAGAVCVHQQNSVSPAHSCIWPSPDRDCHLGFFRGSFLREDRCVLLEGVQGVLGGHNQNNTQLLHVGISAPLPFIIQHMPQAQETFSNSKSFLVKVKL